MLAAEINPTGIETKKKNFKYQQQMWRMKNITLTSKTRAKYWEWESPRHQEKIAV